MDGTAAKTPSNKTHSYGPESLLNKVSTLSFISMAHKICEDGSHFGLRADKMPFYLFQKIRTHFQREPGGDWNFKQLPFIWIVFYVCAFLSDFKRGIWNKARKNRVWKKWNQTRIFICFQQLVGLFVAKDVVVVLRLRDMSKIA